ncbi:MAG TPA: hypothetical protein VGI00_24990 [Streptosporangiaceae bacterium]|jgi:hypothetical protein
MFVGEYSDKTAEEKEEILRSYYTEANLDDLEIDNDRLYLTIEISRPYSINVNTQYKFLWGADTNEELDPAPLMKFANEAGPLLDSAVGWILNSTRVHLNLGRLILGDSRAVLVLPGKAAVRVVRTVANAHAGTISLSGWDNLPWDDFDRHIAGFISRPQGLDSLIATPSRWLALASGETDAVRKFLFAFFGLEVLANKYISKHRTALVDELSARIGSVPISELLWPTMPDENAPNRNLVFAFTAMATLVRPDTADRDTQSFREVAKARNSLAHGDADELDNLPVGQTVRLLVDYLLAVTRNAQA